MAFAGFIVTTILRAVRYGWQFFGIFGNFGILFISRLSKLSKTGAGTAAGDVANSGGGSLAALYYARFANFSVPSTLVNFQPS